MKIGEETAQIKSECTGTQVMDWGKNKKNIETLIATIGEVKGQITQEEVQEKFLALETDKIAAEDDVLNRPPSTAKDKISGFLSVFTPTEGYFVSPILINLNVGVFIIMILSGVHIMTPESQSLLDWGANFKPLTLEGQWWRLFTATFLHIGILHLLLNMYALLYIGLLLEPYLGKGRFLAAYLISGIAASLASLWWHDVTISAGASGAIFGLYGVFLALLTTKLLDKSVKKALFTSIAFFVGYNLLNGLKPNSGIDNAAHVGGLLSGLLIGYAFIPSLKDFKNLSLKIATIAALVVVLLISSFELFRSLPNDIVAYDKAMEKFISMESMALEIYELPEETPTEKLLYEIEKKRDLLLE